MVPNLSTLAAWCAGGACEWQVQVLVHSSIGTSSGPESLPPMRVKLCIQVQGPTIRTSGASHMCLPTQPGFKYAMALYSGHGPGVGDPYSVLFILLYIWSSSFTFKQFVNCFILYLSLTEIKFD